MRQVSKELGDFQVSLSQGDNAKVTPKIATEVFSSISYLEDTSPTALARKTGTHSTTMCGYCDPNQSSSPNFNKFVHLMAVLGYEVNIRKITE